jgi:hypothetical protein
MSFNEVELRLVESTAAAGRQGIKMETLNEEGQVQVHE